MGLAALVWWTAAGAQPPQPPGAGADRPTPEQAALLKERDERAAKAEGLTAEGKYADAVAPAGIGRSRSGLVPEPIRLDPRSP